MDLGEDDIHIFETITPTEHVNTRPPESDSTASLPRAMDTDNHVEDSVLPDIIEQNLRLSDATIIQTTAHKVVSTSVPSRISIRNKSTTVAQPAQPAASFDTNLTTSSLKSNAKKTTNNFGTQELELDFENRLEVALDNSVVSFHKTITFVSCDDKSFVLLDSQSRNSRANNEELSEFSNIGKDYNDERELGRKQLYSRFMVEVKKMLLKKQNVLVTYENWAHCFNVVFSHILESKLQKCSSYSYGGVSVVGFRGKQVKKKDNPALVSFFNAQKDNAEKDVKEIMKIINMVLRDCCMLQSRHASDNDILVCGEDYSSVYRERNAVHCEFQSFVEDSIDSGCTTSLINLNALLEASQPEAILMAITNDAYSDAKLSVFNCFICILEILFNDIDFLSNRRTNC